MKTQQNLEKSANLAGAKLAHKLNGPGVMGVIDPFGIAHDEAKIGMRKLGGLQEKLTWERSFAAGFKATWHEYCDAHVTAIQERS